MTGDVEVRRLDLQDLSSVRAFADGIDGDVDVLVNNAGIMAEPHALTKDGFESQIGTNHLGHFALTNLLLPKITDRVVTVSSVMHLIGYVSLKDLNWKSRPYLAWPAYGQSKLANLLFTSELQRRLDAAGSLTASRTPRTPVTRPPTCRATPATGSAPSSGRAPRSWSEPRRHSVPARRCTRCPRICRAIASSARASSCAVRPARPRVARWPATRTRREACGSSLSSSRTSRSASDRTTRFQD